MIKLVSGYFGKVCHDKGWCKKNDTTIVKMNITEFKGYICILID